VGARFKNCDNDVRVVHIGKVLVPKTHKQFKPLVQIWGQPSQKKNGLHATMFSNMPALYRGKILNSERLEESFTHKGTLEFNRNYALKSTHLDEFPSLSTYESLRKAEGKQHAFMISVGEKRVIVPQLELARVLFYSSSYLARASLTSSMLRNDFRVSEHFDRGFVDIEVLSVANFPISAYAHSATRAMLSWLLIDKNARTSFESIFRHYKLHQENTSSYTTWDFSFEPPDMTGWSISYQGRRDSQTNIEFVEKITSLQIDAVMPDKVYFHNARFTHNDSVKPPTSSGEGNTYYEAPDDHIIDDDLDGGNDNNIFQIGEGSLKVKFKKSFITAKSTKPKRSQYADSEDKPKEDADDTVSTGEPGDDGEIPSADIGGGVEDETDHSIEYANRFTAFDLMIEQLILNHNCSKISETTHELPQVGRCKYHLIDNNTSRVIRYVLIQKYDRLSYLLEVDLTGLKKWISTKCIRKNLTQDWSAQFNEIKEELVKKSISWPTNTMDGMFGEGSHVGINHPHSIKGESTGIPTESIANWAAKVAVKL
jgi:hypothetical protein